MKKQIFGAVLLSAALAVGTCMPAFADPDPDYAETNASFAATASHSAESSVFVKTQISQINVTVPVRYVFAADADGGALIKPTTGTYQFTNNSATKIYINSVKADIVSNSGWSMKDSAISQGANPTTSGIKYGDLYVAITSLDANPIVVNSTLATTAKNISNTTIISGETVHYGEIAAAADTNTPSHLPITIDGSSSKLNKVDDAVQNVFKLTYTISTTPAS